MKNALHRTTQSLTDWNNTTLKISSFILFHNIGLLVNIKKTPKNFHLVQNHGYYQYFSWRAYYDHKSYFALKCIDFCI
jgi:hypothetical protein